MRILLLFIVLYAAVRVNAQVPPGMEQEDEARAETRHIINTYLRTTGDATGKIKELIKLAQQHEINEIGTAIIYLEAALVLEKYAMADSATFALNFCLGNIFSRFNPGSAIYFFKKCLYIGSAARDVNPEDVFQALGLIASQFNMLGRHDSVIAYYHLADDQAAKVFHASVAHASMLNNIGIYYARIGRYDSAMYYYHSALEKLGSVNNDAVLYCSITDNIAQQNEREGNPQAALKTYYFNDSVYMVLSRPTRYVINKIRLLVALAKTNGAGLKIQNQLTQLANYITANYKTIQQREIINFYRYAMGYFLRAGDNKMAAFYSGLYNNLEDSASRQSTEKVKVLSTALLKIQEAGFKNEFEKQGQLVKQQKTIIWVTVALAIAGIAAIWLLVLYMGKRRQEYKTAELFAEEQLKTKALEAQAAVHELEMKKKDLLNVVLHNNQVYMGNRRLIESLNKITRKRGNNNVEKSLRSVLVDLKNNTVAREGAMALQHNIQHVNASFYDKLKEAFPHLTAADIELCGYIRSNLANKDIAQLKKVEPSSIKMSKNRLKKKLGLSSTDDLTDFVSQF